MKTLRPTALACAIALAFGVATPAFAQSNADVLKELAALKARIADLEKKLAAVPDAPADGQPAQWGMTPEQAADFNKLVVKSEALEDAQESHGYKNLKVSGYMDPTYIWNKNQNRAGFQFLSPVSKDGYNYDNSYFGTVQLDFQKELEGGTKWRLTLMPQRGAGSVADPSSHSIVHEASFSIPLGDLQTRLIAGQIPDWSGYEYIQPTTTKLVTRGLLLDFTEPTTYTGAGMEIIRGKYDVKAVIANFNSSLNRPKQFAPVLAYRLDYSKGEFSGWGLAGVEGKVANFNNGVLGGASQNTMLHLIEADAYFIRGDLTLQGQVGFGKQRGAAITPDADGNARDAQWWGVSGLAAYKLDPRFEAVVRADYINDQKNGGGLLGYTGYWVGATEANSGTFGDTRNGIGVSPNCQLGADCKGANRAAIAMGFNYLLTANTTVKAEYRLDLASQAVFLDAKTLTYKKNNSLLGATMVVSF
ncbi:MAG: DUF3138 family protein [Caulobacter sp.]|nr:DUF3138 family protein [Vitreoscilla sp.]